MKNVQVMDCTQPASIKLERVNFFTRQLLTVDDMTTERDYFLQKLRRHNRFLHGWGVVCGLPVTAAPTKEKPWRVQIGSGYALGPYGDEIFVGEAVYFDLAACLTGGSTSPCEPNMLTPGGAGTSTTAYVAIKYAECLSRPVQVASTGCGCDSDPCQYSRIRDSFQIQCLPQLPPAPPPPVSLCNVVRGGAIAPCPPCPTDPWVVLAKITLPSASTMNITNSDIDNAGPRRVILSTAVLQEQLVRCCCGPASSSSSSSLSSSSSSSSSRLQGFLNVAQRATQLAAPAGAVALGTQVAVTVLNNSAQAAEKVIVTVTLDPVLPTGRYVFSSDAAWQTVGLDKLVSKPFALAAGNAQTISFVLASNKESPTVTITSNASAVDVDGFLAGNAGPIQVTILK